MKDAIKRAKLVVDARIYAPETAGKVEEAVARELLSVKTFQRDAVVRPMAHLSHGALSPMEATGAFAKALERAMTAYAAAVGGKAPKRGKYDPLFSTEAIFREIWQARQLADELGIPYEFYCDSAVTFYWLDPGNKRCPRPLRLLEPDIREHVMKRWAGLQRAAQRMRDVSAGSSVMVPAMPVAVDEHVGTLPISE